MQQILEWAPFRLRVGKSETALLAASDEFQRSFLETQPGFLRRELIRLGGGQYADVVLWRSRKDADAVMEKAAESGACNASFAAMDDASSEPGAGVAHYELASAYQKAIAA